MQINKLLAILILSVVTLASSARARDISMLTVEWARHYGSELPEQGLTSTMGQSSSRYKHLGLQ